MDKDKSLIKKSEVKLLVEVAHDGKPAISCFVCAYFAERIRRNPLRTAGVGLATVFLLGLSYELFPGLIIPIARFAMYGPIFFAFMLLTGA